MNTTMKFKFVSRICVVLLLSTTLQACVVGNVVGTAVGATVEVIKIPFKVAGAAVDVIIPGG